VFPGQAVDLVKLTAAGVLPATEEAYIRQGDNWVLARRLPAISATGAVHQSTETYRLNGVSSSLLDRMMSRPELRERGWARRLQPRLDHREADILKTLLHPGSFPFRLTNFVEGRILLAIGSLCAGGAERQVVNTAAGLRARGHMDVHILAENLDNRPADRFYLERAGSHAASVRASAPWPTTTHPWALEHPAFRAVLTDGMISRILGAAKAIYQLAPEVVSISLDWPSITVGLAAVLAGVPHIFVSGRNISPIHFAFFQWFMYPCYRALARCPQVHLLNNSEAGRIDYAKWLRLSSEKIRVVRNGIVTGHLSVLSEDERAATRAQLDIAPHNNLVVGVFRLSPEKRPLLWIRAAQALLRTRSDVTFVLCGTGSMQGQVENYVNAQGLSSHIRLLGVRSDAERIMGSADLVMMASEHEGTPNALIEAQAMGVPVVTTPAFGAAEAIDDERTGKIVPQASPDALARAMLDLLDDRQFRHAVREYGPAFIEKRFGMERMTDDMLAAFIDAGATSLVPYVSRELRFVKSVELSDSVVNGFCCTARAPALGFCCDTASEPSRSPVVVLEDGKPLGPAHAVHEDIRKAGGGAFSHWGEYIFFSSSDGTDPRVNGRSYLAVIPRWRSMLTTQRKEIIEWT
jgi:glycosyltransferase involved in cell wall biosynthesis